MTATDYAHIRHRLDHPLVVVWDPCAVTLAADDPETLPKPSSPHFVPIMLDQLPIRPAMLCVAFVAADMLRPGSPNPVVDSPSLTDSAVLRAVLRAVRRWLDYAPLAGHEVDALCAKTNLTSTNGNPLAVAAWHLARALRPLSDDGLKRWLAKYIEQTLTQQGERDRWWARCRALLPIADVTTAEIEWGDIELPPRPLADDLPGDGAEP